MSAAARDEPPAHPSPDAASSHKLHYFEGLRGIAAVAVVVHHLRQSFFYRSAYDLHAALSPLPAPLANAILWFTEGLYNGTFAVWLFWIMSGFVLSLQFFLRARTDPPRARLYLADAALRRYPRLMIPVLATAAFAFAIHAAGLMYNRPAAAALPDPRAATWLARWYDFPANPLVAIKSAVWNSFVAYNEALTYSNVLWTMEKEFLGSLFLFAFLAVAGTLRLRLAAYLLVGIVAYATHYHWINAFLVGIALCDLYINRRVGNARQSKRPALAAVAALLGWITILIGIGYPYFRDDLYFLLAAAAVALTLLSPPTQRLLARSIPVFLGKISFGVYLIHMPLICSLGAFTYLQLAPPLGHGLAATLASAATLIASLLLGYALHQLADRPALTASRWLASRLLGRGATGT